MSKRSNKASTRAKSGEGHTQARGRSPTSAAKGDPWVPRGVPTAVFVVATAVLFAEFIFSREMLFGSDTMSLGYMARAFFAERLTAWDFPLWSPRLLGGIPSIEALAAGDSIYPTSLLYFIMEPYRALGWKLVLHVLAGGFFMFGWIRSLDLGRAAATLAGLAWVMAPVIVTLVFPGNDGKLMVASLAPLAFWATESLFRAPGPRTVAAMAGAVALPCLTTQFQTAYFLFGSVGAYAVFRMVSMVRAGGAPARRPALVAGTLFLTGSLLGAGISAIQLYPAAKYVTESSRRIATTVDATPEEARAYSSSWSYHPEEVLGLVVPEFVGNSGADASWAQGTYWGRNGVKLNHEYTGVVILLLAALGLAGGGKKKGTRWFMAGMGTLWLLFALGSHTPVWRVFYELVPGISLFRVPSLSAFLVSLAATTLFAFAVDDLITSEARPKFLAEKAGQVMLWGVGVLLAGLVLQVTGVLPSLWTSLFYSGIVEQRSAALITATPFITRGFFLALLFATATTVAAWGLATRRITAPAFATALAVLVAADLGRVDRAFIETLDFYAWSSPDANARFLQERLDLEDPFRVADLRNEQNVDLAMYGVDLVAGHHPNDLARYRSLLGLEGSQARARNLRHPVVLRMLNAKYLVWPETVEGGPPFDAAPLSRVQGPRGTEAVYAYPALDRAWVVGSHQVMDDEAALNQMLVGNFNPAQEVILAQAPTVPSTPNILSSVTWISDDPDERHLVVEVSAPALLVFSENWFPGWQVEVDGTEQELLRANLTLGAVEILRAGRHDVVLRYTAPTVARASMFSLLCLLLATGLWAVPAALGLKRRGQG